MRYWLETLGCPKNQVDSDKLAGVLEADGYRPAGTPAGADVIVVNTCAFIEAARQESVDTILDLAEARRPGARLVVTGCLAERYGVELAEALPEVDRIAGFGSALVGGPDDLVTGAGASGGTPVVLGVKPGKVPDFDLLNLPRPARGAPWAYVKVAEGCNRSCGFCAIPSFRGPQRSRDVASILAEVEALGVAEVVLVAQDLASYGSDLGRRGAIVEVVAEVAARVARTRLLYLYPSDLTPALVDVMGTTGCHYFDLSLQHVSRPHLRRMRRWGDGTRFAARVAELRGRYPDAAFRSSFIVGYPGETEEDHDQLLRFLEEVQLDWAGFFPFSPEDGTYALGLPDPVPTGLAAARLAECGEIQDAITASSRAALIGTVTTVLVDRPGVARSHREAPEIDGVIRVPRSLTVGSFAEVEITGVAGIDLEGQPRPAADGAAAHRAGPAAGATTLSPVAAT